VIDEKRIECDGHTYRLRPWDYKDGQRWLFRILTAAASGASGNLGSNVEAALSIVKQFDEETLAQLVETCERYTDLVSRDEQGRETVTQLATVRAAHMRRRYVTMVLLMKEHCTAEFGDFFARVPELAGDVGAKASAK
jgi:hypothetical protein